MAETPKKQVIEQLYAACTTGDVDAVTASFAPDVVWHEGGVHQLRGEESGSTA